MFFREVNLFCPYFAKFPKTPVPAKPVKSANFPGFSGIFLWQSAANRDKSPAIRYWTEQFPYQCTSTGISRRSSKYPESGIRKTGRIIHPVIQPNKRPAQKELLYPHAVVHAEMVSHDVVPGELGLRFDEPGFLITQLGKFAADFRRQAVSPVMVFAPGFLSVERVNANFRYRPYKGRRVRW